jgi:starch synthase
VRGRFLKRARLVVFHSRYAREAFVERVPLPRRARDVVVPLGVFDLFAGLCEPVPEEPRTVLFFGRLAPYKGIEVLRDAAPAIAARVPDARFVLAGGAVPGFHAGPPPDLPPGASWEAGGGHVGLGELCRLFRAATIVVLPYVEASQSGVVSTAFAFGKPVVATAVGGIPEVVEDGLTGCLVPANDASALAAAVAGLLEDPGARSRLAAGVAERAAGELSAHSVARATVEAYRQIAAQSS